MQTATPAAKQAEDQLSVTRPSTKQSQPEEQLLKCTINQTSLKSTINKQRSKVLYKPNNFKSTINPTAFKVV